MFELNTIYTYDAPIGNISPAGIKLINQLISVQRISSDMWQHVNKDNPRNYLPVLPDDWQWQWIVTGKGDYVGTFAKRVDKYYWKEHNLHCPPQFLSEIGQIARQHSENIAHYEFEFVNKFDWNAGDYGDAGSCFWGSKAGAKNIIADNGGLAIRFYESGNGMARAWLAPYNGAWIVFNGYGYDTLTIARVLAGFTGKNYKKISLTNHASTTGTVWINGSKGYLVADIEITDSVYSVNLEWGDENYCESCGNSMADDETYITPNGEHFCENCYDERYSTCEICDETVYRDDMYYIDSEGIDVCSNCLDHYHYCDSCNEYYSEITVVADDVYCDRCLSRLAYYCEKCEDYHLHNFEH